MHSSAAMIRDVNDSLYSSALERGRRGTLWAPLTGRSRSLIALEEVREKCRGAAIEQSQLHAETLSVPVAQILGSDGRCGDFDRDFNPLHDHNRGRWLRIAAARRRGTPLPPVDLVQVGDLYFVQDGHHRVSVARALGQADIRARVTVWRVSGPLPWETHAGRSEQGPSRAHSTSPGLRTLVGRLYDGILTYARALQPGRREWAARGGL